MMEPEFQSIWSGLPAKTWRFNANLPGILWRRFGRMLAELPEAVFREVCENAVLTDKTKPSPQSLIFRARDLHEQNSRTNRTQGTDGDPWFTYPQAFRDIVAAHKRGELTHLVSPDGHIVHIYGAFMSQSPPWRWRLKVISADDAAIFLTPETAATYTYADAEPAGVLDFSEGV